MSNVVCPVSSDTAVLSVTLIAVKLVPNLGVAELADAGLLEPAGLPGHDPKPEQQPRQHERVPSRPALPGARGTASRAAMYSMCINSSQPAVRCLLLLNKQSFTLRCPQTVAAEALWPERWLLLCRRLSQSAWA